MQGTQVVDLHCSGSEPVRAINQWQFTVSYQHHNPTRRLAATCYLALGLRTSKAVRLRMVICMGPLWYAVMDSFLSSNERRNELARVVSGFLTPSHAFGSMSSTRACPIFMSRRAFITSM